MEEARRFGENRVRIQSRTYRRITKNLVSVGQIVDQGMQVRFTHFGCFIEEEGRVIRQGRRDGRMFILDSTDGGTATFKGFKSCNRNR